MYLYKKERYKSSFQFLAIASSDREHSSFFYCATPTFLIPSLRFIDLFAKSVSGRNYTIGENSSAATRSIFLHQLVQLLYPPGTANILQPGPKKPVSLLRAPCTNLVSIGAWTVAIPVHQIQALAEFIFQRGLRSASRPGIVPPTTLQDASAGLKDGWIFMFFWNAPFASCPGDLRGSRDRVVNLAALKDNSRTVTFSSIQPFVRFRFTPF